MPEPTRNRSRSRARLISLPSLCLARKPFVTLWHRNRNSQRAYHASHFEPCPLPASRRVCGFAFTPAPGYCLFLSFSDSIRSARCMGSACSPTVQPAVPASTVALRPLEALRANSRRTALWLPCQPRRPWTLGSTSPAAKLTPGYLPGNSCCAFWLRLRLPFVYRSGNRDTGCFPVRRTSPAPKHTHVRRGVSGFLSAPSFVC